MATCVSPRWTVVALVVASCAGEVPRHDLGTVTRESTSAIIAWLDEQEAAGETLLGLDIDSSGGDVDAGFALIRRMDAAVASIECVVGSAATSMAFAILQSCATRTMVPWAALMAHEARLYGGVTDAEDAAVLQATNDALAVQCSRRLRISIDDYKEKVNGRRWWMSSREALAINAVDRVVGGSPWW